MNLKDIIADTKSAWVDFDGVKGFEVELNYIPRSELTKMLNDSKESKFNRSKREIELTTNEDKFMDKFIQRAVTNWRGLNTENIQEFVAVKVEPGAEKAEIKYSHESALLLAKESTIFDEWVNSRISDLDSFRN